MSFLPKLKQRRRENWLKDGIVELLGKKEAELERFGKFSAYPSCKKMKKHSGMRTLRVWPADHLMKRWVWISHLYRSQELFSKIMEGRPQDNSEIIRAVSLVSKWGTMVFFFKRLDGLHPKVWGHGHVEPWDPNPVQQICGGRTNTPVGPKGGTFTPRPVG